MNVTISDIGNNQVIKLEGEMILGNEANDFHEAIHSGIEANKKNIIVDLSMVKFLSSWGIGMLIHGYTTASNNGIAFMLASVPENINETFRKIKIDTIFKQFINIEEALKN